MLFNNVPQAYSRSHRQVAYSMAFWTMIHVTAHYINFINIERRREFTFSIALNATLAISTTELRPNLAVQVHYTQNAGITGHFMLLIMLIMYVVSAILVSPSNRLL